VPLPDRSKTRGSFRQNSPATNPAIQLGSGIFAVKMTGLSTGVNSINSDFKKSDKPPIIDALKLSIFINPSIDR
jgi:hypothetical protein